VSISTLGPAASSYAAADRSLQLAIAAARAAADNQGREIAVLDMRGQTAIFDFFVLATGTSRRQLHAMSEEIDNKLERELHDHRMSLEGYRDSRWILLDYGSVVIHLFDDETRSYYGLEDLWGEAEKIDLTSYGIPRDQLMGSV
jgi:ribosome-associated protein